MNTAQLINWMLRLTVAIVLLQTLYFKFTAHPDSVHIFSALGVEPWGRLGLGCIELITAILILLPRTQVLGMAVSLGIIIGAIVSHLLVLGINVENDGGGLFSLALVVLVASSIYLTLHRKQWLQWIKNLKTAH
jgi:putative oxidoreductase